VMGGVSLGNATLEVSLGFTPALDDRFILINNDGHDAIEGTFQGLPEDTLVTVGGQQFRITYEGGDGNDVELIRTGVGLAHGNLIVHGTAGADAIRFIPSGNAGAIEVLLNGVSQGTFTPAEAGRILCYGHRGNDDIQVAGGIGRSAWLYGGGGDDRLQGGAGHHVLMGGAGAGPLLRCQGRHLLLAPP